VDPRVYLISGSAPPDPCGVGDYTAALASAVGKAGFPVEMICHRSWGMQGTLNLVRTLRRDSQSLIHIQYPTMGYGYSLGPQLFSLCAGEVVTLHEFSAAHVVRKLSLIPFTLRASRVVVSSEFEKQALAGRIPWVRRRLQVIPIGTNLADAIYEPDEDLNRVAYFGLITPSKGLEEFIQLARILRDHSFSGPIAVLGKIPSRHNQYARLLMEVARPYFIEWILDRDSETVSQLLAKSSICYLPFPDGASERRGSLKAACSIGLPCVTTKGRITPPGLSDAVLIASNPMEAANVVLRLLGNKEERQRLSRLARNYAQGFSWEKIASSHIEMYLEIQRLKTDNPRGFIRPKSVA
jgi:glycosyltransferase involved in cell wall biosynthesis